MSTQLSRVALQKTNFGENADVLALIQQKFLAASTEQLRNTIISLCENIVRLTADAPDDDTFMIASLHIMDAALDENSLLSAKSCNYFSN